MALGSLRTAVVTGACGGIGSHIVRRLREADVTVQAISHRPAELETVCRNTGASPVLLDISDAGGVSSAIAPQEIDILVNAAAVLGETSNYHDTRPETAQTIVNVNIIGFENMIRAIVPGMIERNRGHVLSFGSISGMYPTSGQPMYSASKAAVHLMMQNLRMELFGTDIRVSEIMPGRVKTGMHAEMFSGDHEKSNDLVYGDYECLSPQDVADAVLYILAAPPHVDITQLEIMPTHQVMGGARFHSRSRNDNSGAEAWRNE